MINYDKQFIEFTKNLKNKPKLLLHACCAPCLSGVIEKVQPYFDVTVYFYNPNIIDKAEYDKRSNELIRLCKEFNLPSVLEEYNKNEYLTEIKGLENEAEGGSRCDKCFGLRLLKSGEYAVKNGFQYFATTLTVSPLKNAVKINGIGLSLGERLNVEYLPTDFKKRGGYLRSIELSKKYGLYRQNFCGCEFSKK